MQLNLGFFALAGMVASLVGATALPNAAVTVEERADEAAQFDGHLFVCVDENWSGACLNIGFYAQQCQNFPSGFDNQITSVGPDQGWQCHLLIDYNCNPDQGDYWVEAPGFSDLTYGNDAFSSFVCYKN